MKAQTEILVIGAGIAGLTAAHELKKTGFDVQILEARPRAGGRICTHHVPECPIPIELGAEFVHGRGNHVTKFLKAAGQATYQVPDEHAYRDGREWKNEKNFWDQLACVMKDLREPGTKDRSFREYLREKKEIPSHLRDLALAFVEGFHAARAELISEHSLYIAEQSTQADAGSKTQRLLQGYGALAHSISRPIEDDIVLNCPVEKLIWSEGWAEAVTPLGNIRADKALVTLPLGVLKNFKFEPGLPEQTEALKKLHVGPVTKLCMLFKKPFWKDEIDFYHSPKKIFHTWWTQAPVQVPLLTAWVGGPAAEMISDLSEDKMLDLALADLADLFDLTNDEITKNFIEMWTHNWQKDPYSQGAYSYIGVDGVKAQKLFLSSVRDTLYFAGEAFAPGGETGMVDAAIESGMHAARQICSGHGSSKMVDLKNGSRRATQSTPVG